MYKLGLMRRSHAKTWIGDFIWLDEWQTNTSSAPDDRTR